MSKVNPQAHYSALLNDTIEKLRFLKSKLSSMIWQRLAAFLLVVFFVYLSFDYNYYFFIPTLLCAVLFLYLIRINAKYLHKRKYFEKMIWVIEQELIGLKNNHTGWDDGKRFINKNHFSNDLDLFGSFSIFHLINRTSTTSGASLLASYFSNPLIDKQQIILRQESIKEFAVKNDFRLSWQATAGMLPNKSDLADSLQLSSKKVFSSKAFFTYVPIILAALTILSAGYYYFTNEHVPFMLLSFLNLTIIGTQLKSINQKHAQITGINKTIQNYKELFGLYLSNTWQSLENKAMFEAITDAEKAMGELEKICERFDQRMNFLVGVTFNALWLNDIFVSIQLEKWIEKHNDNTKYWFNVIAKIDALQSMGTFDFNNDYTYPELSLKNELCFEDLCHPLISKNNRVANSLSTTHPQKIILITGSNMSGKSTFLRSVGVNLVLAQAGLPVCAKTFVFMPMLICASLRQSDSLEENVSLFHAELIRLKEIRAVIGRGQLCLVLLDEMLRGTNSEDKLHGSQQLIEEFVEENLISFIATHDLALGDLENKHGQSIRNYCFESQIMNNELIFDYKLKPGLARNKNASFLLRKMNIITS